MRNLYIVLILAIGLALWRSQTPAPKPADAAPQEFSATRAFADITAMAQRPHPVGSPDHTRVEAYLVRRLAGMGLTPQLQSERTTASLAGHWTVSAPVTNIAAVLKGRDSRAPAALVMSHYDSVFDSPGAADDSAGVASSLEILRALKAGPVPAHDVIFLFTDGEELGLVGAAGFFAHNPLAKHVGAVVNFEARGDSGLAAMFETGPENADTVARWSANAPRPNANSLSRAIYRKMPNGSDLTVAIQRGLPGINIAFIGDEAAYHTPLATPAHLDLGSVQHMGDEGLAGVLAFAAAIPAQRADAVYSDVLGFFLIEYSIAFGWALFAIAAVLALYAVVVGRRLAPDSWGRGVLAAAASVILPLALLLAAGFAFRGENHFLRLAHVDELMAGAAAIAIGCALFGAQLFRRPAAVWPVWLLLAMVVAGLAQVLLPEGAFAFVWPLLAAAIMAVVRFRIYCGADGPVPTAICTAIAVLVVAEAAAAGLAIFTAVGVDLPVVMVLPLFSVMPVLLLLPGRPAPRAVPLVVALVGIALFAYGTLAPHTAARPAPSLIRYVADLDSGKAFVVDYLGARDGWTRRVLNAERPLPWSPDRSGAPTRTVAVPATAFAVSRRGGGLVLSVTPDPSAISVTLSVRAAGGIGDSRLNGIGIGAIAPNTWHDLRYYHPDKIVWTLPISGKLEVQIHTLYPGWPHGAVPLPALPADKMLFENAHTTETVMRRTL